MERHGGWYPTSGSSRRIRFAAARLKKRWERGGRERGEEAGVAAGAGGHVGLEGGLESARQRVGGGRGGRVRDPEAEVADAGACIYGVRCRSVLYGLG
jgi:hypothetical protein